MNRYQDTLNPSRPRLAGPSRLDSVFARLKRAAQALLGIACVGVAGFVLHAASPDPIGTEILGDPDFELSTPDGSFPDHAWQPAWAPLESGAVCTTTAGRTGHGLWAYTGSRPIEWWTGPYQQFAVVPGAIYRAGAWIRTPPGGSWVEGSRALVRLLFLDAAGNTLNTFDSPAITAPQGWERFEVVSTPATGAVASVRFVCYLEKPQVAGQSLCNFDDTSLVAEKPAPTATGTGLFNPGPSIGQGGRKVAIVDVNNDGHLDVVTGAGANLVSTNNGFGQFTPTGQDFGGATSWALAAGDVNHDGNVDLFLNQDYMMELWLGDGLGSFSDSGQRMGYATIRHAFLADLNGDHALDLVLVNEVAPNEVYFNNGEGQFRDSGQVLGSLQNRSYGGAALDFDGDGDLDLVFTNLEISTAEFGSLHLFINDGRGQFTERGPGFGTPGLRYRTVAAGDLDRDGRPDLFVGREFGVEVWLNDGGAFVRAQELSSWAFPWDVAVFDVDQDGDLDAVTAQWASQPSISEVWINDGRGRFLNSGRHLCCGQSFGIAVGDLNADSSPDLVLSGPSGRVWLNQPFPPRITLDPITAGRLTGQAAGLDLAIWRTYLKAYVAAYAPGQGWSTPGGCEVSPFTPLAEDGRFIVNGIPDATTRILAVLAPTGANVFNLPCLDKADNLPPELDLLGLAKTVVEGLKLTASLESEQLVLRWPSESIGARLETAPEVVGPWSEVTVHTPGEYRVSKDPSRAFFRLR